MLSSGLQKSLVHKVKELEVLLTCNKSYCAETIHNISSKNHKAIVERAASWPSEVSVPMPGWAAKKMNAGSLYASCICVNKTVKPQKRCSFCKRGSWDWRGRTTNFIRGLHIRMVLGYLLYLLYSLAWPQSHHLTALMLPSSKSVSSLEITPNSKTSTADTSN